MRIGYLRAGFVPEELQPQYGEYYAMYRALFRRHYPSFNLRCYEVSQGELPEPQACDAWLCSGSVDSVYDDLPWIEPLKQFVRRVYENGGRMAGICFGHQLMAEALGGKVARSENGWGIGLHEVRLSGARDWMTPFRRKYNLFYSHQDQVQRLPEGADCLGGSDHCPVAIYTVDNRFLGIQGHPEFNRDYTEALLRSRRDRIGAKPLKKALATLDGEHHRHDVLRWIGLFLAEEAERATLLEEQASCSESLRTAMISASTDRKRLLGTH